MSHEFDLIAAIRQQSRTNESVVVGIGDDAAVLRCESGEIVVATDMLMEGVHFIVEEITPELIGRKALAVNLSDIAAMAGTPTSAFVSVALPRKHGQAFAERCLRGVQQLADEYQVAIAGGDTNIWDGPLVINVAVIGTAGPAGGALRCGAKVGDAIFVSGDLGGSRSGRHLTFTPRLDLAAHIAKTAVIHAMIDISDGPISDLGHILDESNVGAVLDLSRIPIHLDVDAALPPADRLHHALHDGEDFELLFCVSEADAEILTTDWPFDVPLTRIGRIVEPPGCWSVDADGVQVPMQRAGWEHKW